MAPCSSVRIGPDIIDAGNAGGSLLRRRVGEEIGQPAVEVPALVPDRRVEAPRQAGLQLCGGKAGDAGVVGNISGTLGQVADTACVGVPISIGDCSKLRIV